MSATVTGESLGSLDAIPLGEGRVFRVCGEEIAVFRTRGGEVFATEAVCPHRGGPLADGVIDRQSVVCPLHGYAFDLRTGHAHGSACRALKVYGVAVDESSHITLVGE